MQVEGLRLYHHAVFAFYGVQTFLDAFRQLAGSAVGYDVPAGAPVVERSPAGRTALVSSANQTNQMMTNFSS